MSGIGSDNGWLEAAIAWEVCASLHRQYCKGKDALFTTRQSDFVKHAENARGRASNGQAPAETGNSVSAQTDSVLYDPKAVLDVFNSARAGSDKSSGYLCGILAVIAHWESRPEPHRWMVPVQAQAAESVPAGDERATFEANWRARNPHMPLNSRLRDDGRYGDHLIQKEWEAWQARAARASADSVQEDAARYRWLRDQAHPDSEDSGIAVSESGFNDCGNKFTRYYSGEELDAAIDAARAADSGVQEDAARESEYRRGYRHGYEQRDAEVRGAMA